MTQTTPMTDPVAQEVARSLLAADCARMRTDEPFRLPSGWASPVYMNCRKFISFPEIRRKIVRQALALLKERGCLTGLTAVAGADSGAKYSRGCGSKVSTAGSRRSLAAVVFRRSSSAR